MRINAENHAGAMLKIIFLVLSSATHFIALAGSLTRYTFNNVGKLCGNYFFNYHRTRGIILSLFLSRSPALFSVITVFIPFEYKKAGFVINNHSREREHLEFSTIFTLFLFCFVSFCTLCALSSYFIF